jgi:hypothetical protein
MTADPQGKVMEDNETLLAVRNQYSEQSWTYRFLRQPAATGAGVCDGSGKLPWHEHGHIRFCRFCNGCVNCRPAVPERAGGEVREDVAKATSALAEILMECEPDAMIDDNERVTNIANIATKALYGTDRQPAPAASSEPREKVGDVDSDMSQ